MTPKPSKAERAAQRERKKSHDRVARRLEKLEAQIAEEEGKLEAYSWKLADPEIASDAERLQSLDGERAELRSVIDDLYRDWERTSDELSALRDGLS